MQSKHSDSEMETSDQNKGTWIIGKRACLVQFLRTSKQAQLLCLTYKKLYRQVYRVYIIVLRYRHDCDQFKVAEHSFQVPMANSPLLLNYL